MWKFITTVLLMIVCSLSVISQNKNNHDEICMQRLEDGAKIERLMSKMLDILEENKVKSQKTCPVCGKHEIKPVFHTTKVRGNRHHVTAEYKCIDCESIFNLPIITQE